MAVMSTIYAEPDRWDTSRITGRRLFWFPVTVNAGLAVRLFCHGVSGFDLLDNFVASFSPASAWSMAFRAISRSSGMVPPFVSSSATSAAWNGLATSGLARGFVSDAAAALDPGRLAEARPRFVVLRFVFGFARRDGVRVIFLHQRASMLVQRRVMRRVSQTSGC